MSRTLVLRPAAEEDIAEARDWLEDQREGLGGEFLDEVHEAFARIRESPELYAPEYKPVRRAPTRRFSYIVYYRTLGEEEVEVIAVQHASRHPRRWRSRA